MGKKYIQEIGSKLSKTRSLMRSSEINRHIPLTKKYTRSTLLSMLKSYHMVYVKPDVGTGGSGIMRVDSQGKLYQYQLQKNTKKFTQFNVMATSIENHFRRRTYLVQRGVHLLRYNKRPFDLRIMVQYNPDKKWETTGIIGRTASPDKIVTNVCQGGYSVSVEKLLDRYFSTGEDMKKFLVEIRRLGQIVGEQLNKTYPKLKEIGIDVGLDSQLKPWILEVNTRPAIYGFKSLKDKQIYQKIVRYSKGYGRL